MPGSTIGSVRNSTGRFCGVVTCSTLPKVERRPVNPGPSTFVPHHRPRSLRAISVRCGTGIQSVSEVDARPVSGPVRCDNPDGLSIGEAARLTKVSVYTLRYYERAGLVITPVDRTAGATTSWTWTGSTYAPGCEPPECPIQTMRRYAGGRRKRQ
ncbi:MerR family DNA-binding transcriptional regulator [Nocardia sp. CA-135953]|uniref:MerR family DNA-binding transcriptional regulator n=1 Tax=Nocardia sp. CA-135953 TaxID=3239978 RepID=UPI003D998915